MQIDFHLGTTYVIARLAGFSPSEANVIASSAQYVDDAVKEGTILFKNRAAFNFIASAHKMLDYRNFRDLSNHTVWIPFHFLPSNEIKKNSGIADPFFNKLICRPNSIIAQEMLINCSKNFSKTFGLYLTGITSHVYVDTWAHQGFVGMSHEYNTVTDIFKADGSVDQEMLKYRKKYFKKNLVRSIWDHIQSWFVGKANPVGHGCVLSYPDLPYLSWAYKDWKGQMIYRNNTEDFISAATHLYDFYIKLRKDHALPIPPRIEKDWDLIAHLLANTNLEEGDERLKIWKQEIQAGSFSFGQDIWDYVPEGPESWLDEAFPFQKLEDFEFENVDYKESFLNSRWKNLHDALLFHRYSIIHEILPKYEIIVA